MTFDRRVISSNRHWTRLGRRLQILLTVLLTLFNRKPSSRCGKAMENSAKSYMSAYFASLERVSARLRRVSRFRETPTVNNRPTGLPGPMGRSALSHRPTGGGARAPQSGLVHSHVNSSTNCLVLQRGAYGWKSFSLWQAASRRVRPKARLARGPVGESGTPAMKPALSTPLRCGQRSRPPAGAESSGAVRIIGSTADAMARLDTVFRVGRARPDNLNIRVKSAGDRLPPMFHKLI